MEGKGLTDDTRHNTQCHYENSFRATIDLTTGLCASYCAKYEKTYFLMLLHRIKYVILLISKQKVFPENDFV